MSWVFKEVHKTLRPNINRRMKRAFQHLTKDYSYGAKSGDDHRCTLQQLYLDLDYSIKVLCISLCMLYEMWIVNFSSSHSWNAERRPDPKVEMSKPGG